MALVVVVDIGSQVLLGALREEEVEMGRQEAVAAALTSSGSEETGARLADPPISPLRYSEAEVAAEVAFPAPSKVLEHRAVACSLLRPPA